MFVLGAADTFRAAAIDQLQIWGISRGSIVRQEMGSPASVALIRCNLQLLKMM
jgi:fused signal recognition particle receptor